jgi:hypothetical protein
MPRISGRATDCSEIQPCAFLIELILALSAWHIFNYLQERNGLNTLSSEISQSIGGISRFANLRDVFTFCESWPIWGVFEEFMTGVIFQRTSFEEYRKVNEPRTDMLC